MKRKSVVVLIKKGREQGFLTQDDILEIFPDAENRIRELDELYDHLLAEGVDVFESVTADELESDEKAKEKLEREIEILSKLAFKVLISGVVKSTSPIPYGLAIRILFIVCFY